MPNFYTNVKSRLSKKGISTSKSEILQVAEKLNIDIEKATTEQILAGVEYISSKLTTTPTEVSNLSVVDEFPVESVELATVDKAELITTTATNMGLVLSIEEVTAIAENFDYASQDADSYIQEIEDAITSFLVSKSHFTKQRISTMVQTIKETASRLNNENSQLLTIGLGEVNTDIKRGTEHFKSQVRTALKAFALPPSKSN